MIDPGVISIELRVIGALIVILTGMSLYLIMVAAWIRSANARKERKMNEIQDEFYPKILTYMSGERSLEEVIPERRGQDYSLRLQVLETLLYDYVRHLQGEEYERVQQLLNHQRFLDYHLQQLKSKNDRTRLKACIYFGHLESLPEEAAQKIESFLQSDNRLLGHAAASAMMSSRNLDIRFRALSIMSFQKVISEMALLDLLYEYHRVELDQAEEETSRLLKLIRSELIPEENVALLIRGVADLGLIFAADQLLALLKKPHRYDVTGKITESLIRAMTSFFQIEALPMIRTHIYSPNVGVRKACAKAFGSMGQEEDLKALKNLLFDQDYSVRFEAVQALSEFGEDGQKIIQDFLKRDHGDIRRIAQQVIREFGESEVSASVEGSNA